MKSSHRHWLFGMFLLVLTPTLFAAMSGSEPPPVKPGDTDYAAGVAAFESEDWERVIEHMIKAIERRPWNDNAYNLAGFAYRKLGDYDRSLEHYHKALELNPHNRGALEYLGEAYLELGQPTQADNTLTRLAEECKRVVETLTDCHEWQDLKTAVDGYRKAAQ